MRASGCRRVKVVSSKVRVRSKHVRATLWVSDAEVRFIYLFLTRCLSLSVSAPAFQHAYKNIRAWKTGRAG